MEINKGAGFQQIGDYIFILEPIHLHIWSMAIL